jgi:hypothetical protein
MSGNTRSSETEFIASLESQNFARIYFKTVLYRGLPRAAPVNTVKASALGGLMAERAR